MSFYIGLSVLSNKALQSREGLLLLSRLDALGVPGKFPAADGLNLDTLGPKRVPLESSPDGADPDDLRALLGIEREPAGRPFFRDRRGDFSVSHSGGLCAAAYVLGASRVGCDVEIIRRRRNYLSIAELFYYSGELRYIKEAREEDEGIRRFIRLWVLKESYLKLRGLSIARIKEAPEFELDHPGAEPGGLKLYLWELQVNRENYCLGIILENGRSAEPEFIIPSKELSQKIFISRINRIGVVR